MNYDSIIALKEVCTEEQWNYLKNFKAFIMKFNVNERENDDDPVI